MTASGDDVRAALVLTGLTMSVWLMVGLAPGLRAYATAIRAFVLVAYLVGCGGFLIWLALRG